ncbi:MAG: CDP-alcohol phosphatidyltransferase family protein [Frankia sp.]|nr:CDP-alcohol phosphatidyltransferase family protein [Frankia sp.]
MNQASTARPARPLGAAPAGGYRTALARLAAAQKPPHGAPAYSRFVNRRAGRYLAAAAYVAGLTPNQVTAISGLFTFGGIAVLAAVRPSALTGVVVAVLLAAGYALDSADRQHARQLGGGSPAGEWLDHVLDSAKIPMLHLAVAVCYYRFSSLGRGAFLLVPLGFAVVAVVVFAIMIISDLLRRTRPAANPAGRAGPAPVWRSLLVVPSDYGLLCVSFVLLGAGAAVSGAFTVVYAGLAAANLLYLTGALVRGYRAMAALPRGSRPAAMPRRTPAVPGGPR